MATKYFALLTNIGAAKLAKATALGTKVEITQMAVGDGNGVLPTPDPAQTALIHEIRRAPLNMLTIDPANPSQIIAEQVIPEDVGGWWIREIGLFDKDGDMIAVANCAETYKPQLQEGSGRVQAIRVILIVSSTEAVTLKIDPAVVLATRQYVDNKIIEVKSYADGLMRSHEQSRNHPDATTTAKGFTQLNSSVTDDSEAQAATPKAVKIAMDNASARLAKDRNLADLPNPALARQNLQLGDSSTKNTGTTANTVAAGDDARIAGAMQKNQNGADIPDVAKFLQNLRLGAGAPAIGIPFFWPSSAMPNTVMDEWADMVFLKFNGATFSATTYPKLALVIPSLKLPEARGDFPRIWDDGRGVDSGRALLSEQLDAMQNVTGSLSDNTMGSASSASGVFNVDSGSGVKYAAPSVGNAFCYYGVTFDLSRNARTSAETRPRNIAFNFLVRAK
ncbi:phage tail protein [Citrobacter freundii]|uniref:phage tail protein n=1 Tax=Citrobacter freundii TaxID=546 RepID=UPI0015B13C4F|nr:phage tail protein [Citrobacter freundii]MDV1857690.1 phage tail protein [Citrobacter freundii]MEB0418884.1 phage tail protein [Citrobacter freundii]QLD09527.1 phage tail protein [Citrobacter freundii]